MSLKNTIALITGGAQGLGKSFAEVVLDGGGKVAVLDVKSDVGKKTEQEFTVRFGPKSAIFIGCDIRKQASVYAAFQKTVDTFGDVNLVVNNAGVVTVDANSWERTIDINLTAVMRCCLIAAEFMTSASRSTEAGHIINVASVGGLTGIPFDPAYCASKHGVVGLSRSLAMIWESKGIRISCLCPTFTNTHLVQDFLLTEDRAAVQTVLDDFGLLKISDVARGFKKLAEEPDKTGGVLVVSSIGLKYRYPAKVLGSAQL